MPKPAGGDTAAVTVTSPVHKDPVMFGYAPSRHCSDLNKAETAGALRKTG